MDFVISVDDCVVDFLGLEFFDHFYDCVWVEVSAGVEVESEHGGGGFVPDVHSGV